MNAQALLAIATAIEGQPGMFGFFTPSKLVRPMDFPLDSSLDCKLEFEAKTSPNRVLTLKYVVFTNISTTKVKYLIWVQNYDSGSCRGAVISGLREMASKCTLQCQVDASLFN